MPVHSGLMGPLKNRVNLNSNNNKNKPKNKNAHGAISEIKEDDAADDLYVIIHQMKIVNKTINAIINK